LQAKQHQYQIEMSANSGTNSAVDEKRHTLFDLRKLFCSFRGRCFSPTTCFTGIIINEADDADLEPAESISRLDMCNLIDDLHSDDPVNGYDTLLSPQAEVIYNKMWSESLGTQQGQNARRNPTLGYVRDKLSNFQPTMVCNFGFKNPHSWRGIYMDVAFEPATNITVDEMLTAIDEACSRAFTGYKGGEFYFNLQTPIHISEVGTSYDDKYWMDCLLNELDESQE